MVKNFECIYMGGGGARGPSPPPFFGMYIGSKIIKSWFLKLQKFHFEKGSVTPIKITNPLLMKSEVFFEER